MLTTRLWHARCDNLRYWGRSRSVNWLHTDLILCSLLTVPTVLRNVQHYWDFARCPLSGRRTKCKNPSPRMLLVVAGFPLVTLWPFLLNTPRTKLQPVKLISQRVSADLWRHCISGEYKAKRHIKVNAPTLTPTKNIKDIECKNLICERRLLYGTLFRVFCRLWHKWRYTCLL
jgi:hypothetical protein